MTIRRLITVCILATLAATADGLSAAELEDRKWLEVRTENFTIRSLRNKKDTVEFARHLEAFRIAAMTVTGFDPVDSPTPVEIFALNGYSAPKEFGLKSYSGGNLQSNLRKTWIVTNDINGERETDIALHNFTHFLLRNSRPVNYPLWFHEGMAEFISSLRIRSDDIVVGAIPETAVPIIHRRSWTHLHRILARQANENWGDGSNRIFFGESWALVHYLFLRQEDASVFNEQVVRYSQKLDAGGEPDATFKQVFGASVVDLNRDVREYIKNERAPGISIPIDSVFARFEPEAKRMSQAEISLVLGDYALAQDNIERAQHWFQVAAADESLEPQVTAGLGTVMAAQGRFDEAEQYFDRALELRPDDPQSHLVVANYWRDRAAQTEAPAAKNQFVEKARNHYVQVQQLDPTLPEAYTMYARTLLDANRDSALAVVLLEQAQRLLPANIETKTALAAAYQATGRGADAAEMTRRVGLERDAAEVADRTHLVLVNTRVAD